MIGRPNPFNTLVENTVDAYELFRGVGEKVVSAVVRALGMAPAEVLRHLDSSHPPPHP